MHTVVAPVSLFNTVIVAPCARTAQAKNSAIAIAAGLIWPVTFGFIALAFLSCFSLIGY
jgi:hypothetical protein